MRKYFGTDGIRGRAGQTLTPELALRAGFAFGELCGRGRYSAQQRPQVALGRDPRLSSPMLSSALASGLSMAGCDVLDLGIVPTPVVPFSLLQAEAAGGVMVTASHNPVADNGLKFFGADGYKVPRRTELAIERRLEAALPPVSQINFGTIAGEDPQAAYLRFLRRAVRTRGNGQTLRIVLDCAHGAAAQLAPAAFQQAGFDVHVIHGSFDGSRINVRCGATDLGDLSAAVQARRADLGLAFDGDGDRVLAVDHLGAAVSGDRIIALLATRLPAYRRQGAVVMTHMTNLGVEQALSASGIKLHRTDVGDVQVLAALRRQGLDLGGEQSGHVIMRDLSTAGDGILTGLRLAALVRSEHRSLCDLAAQFPEYPQLLTNLPVRDKVGWREDPKLAQELSAIRRQFRGVRFYLRPSGTENLVRVLTESADPELCRRGNAAACSAINAWDAH